MTAAGKSEWFFEERDVQYVATYLRDSRASLLPTT
jgi:hypothetical protein